MTKLTTPRQSIWAITHDIEGRITGERYDVTTETYTHTDGVKYHATLQDIGDLGCERGNIIACVPIAILGKTSVHSNILYDDSIVELFRNTFKVRRCYGELGNGMKLSPLRIAMDGAWHDPSHEGLVNRMRTVMVQNITHSVMGLGIDNGLIMAYVRWNAANYAGWMRTGARMAMRSFGRQHIDVKTDVRQFELTELITFDVVSDDVYDHTLLEADSTGYDFARILEAEQLENPF